MYIHVDSCNIYVKAYVSVCVFIHIHLYSIGSAQVKVSKYAETINIHKCVYISVHVYVYICIYISYIS